MRYSMGVLLVIIILSSGRLEATEFEHDPPFEDYFTGLLSREDPIAHYNMVVGVLNSYLLYHESTEIVVAETVTGSKLAWDFTTQALTGSINEQAIEEFTFIDEFGRPAFDAVTASGWIDIVGDMLFVGIWIQDEDNYAFAGELPEVEGGPNFAVRDDRHCALRL